MKRRSCQEYRQCFAAREAAAEDEVPSQSSEDHLQLVRGDEDSSAQLGEILDHLGLVFGSGLGRVGGGAGEPASFAARTKVGCQMRGRHAHKKNATTDRRSESFHVFYFFFLKYGQGEV